MKKSKLLSNLLPRGMKPNIRRIMKESLRKIFSHEKERSVH